MRFLILILLLSNQFSLPVEQVGEIELNHCYDKDGWLEYDQLIFYNFDTGNKKIIFHLELEDGRLEDKEAWDAWTKRNITRPESEWEIYKEEWIGYQYIPFKRDGKYNLLFYDGKVLKKVTSKIFNETWTQHDPAEDCKEK